MREVFSPKKSIMRALFFANFLTLKMGGDPNNQASSVSWLPANPNTPVLAILRKANLVFQRASLSHATLFSMVFFALGVKKINYIKNDFV